MLKQQNGYETSRLRSHIPPERGHGTHAWCSDCTETRLPAKKAPEPTCGAARDARQCGPSPLFVPQDHAPCGQCPPVSLDVGPIPVGTIAGRMRSSNGRIKTKRPLNSGGRFCHPGLAGVLSHVSATARDRKRTSPPPKRNGALGSTAIESRWTITRWQALRERPYR